MIIRKVSHLPLGDPRAPPAVSGALTSSDVKYDAMKVKAESRPPAAALLVRAGGVRGLVYTALPVTTFAVTNSLTSLRPALIAAIGVASIILAWQLVRRESTRPALFGFAGVAVCAAFAFITGRAKDFYLPGIWMYLGLAIAIHRVDRDSQATRRSRMGLDDGARRRVAPRATGAVGVRHRHRRDGDGIVVAISGAELPV